jgi:hypothetical protein
MQVVVKRLFSVIRPGGSGFTVKPQTEPVGVREEDGKFYLDLARVALELSGEKMVRLLNDGDLQIVR